MNDRRIGLDLLRIISMMGIVGLHLYGIGGIIENIDVMSYKNIILLFLYVILYFSVDIFGILSGYLNFKKKTIKYNRIVELIFITIFYGVIISLILYIFNIYGFRSFPRIEKIYSLFPALIGRNWYITSYIFVFFMMPYSNRLIESLSKKSLRNMLVVLFILLSIIPNIFFQIDFFKTSSGYSAIWLLYCYLVGGYLGKYGLSEKIKKNRIWLLLGCIVAAYVLNLAIRIGSYKIYGTVLHSTWFIDYVSPFNLLASLLIVSLFSDIKKKSNKLVILISLCTFAVYIIHAHYIIFDYTLLDIMKFTLSHNIFYILGIFIIYLIIIYVVCTLIEIIRIYLFKFLKINKIFDYIGSKLDKLLN